MISRRTAIASGFALAAIGGVGYRAWPEMAVYEEEISRQRMLLTSDPTLEELVRVATLAANSHNTQPWLYRLEQQRISILPDVLRRVSVVDPDDHHLFVSLGCAAENLVLAAGAHGRKAEATITNGASSSITITLAPGQAIESALYKAIPQRQSTRSVYDGQPISLDDLALLKEAAEEEGVSVLFFTEPSEKEAVLEFVIEGNSVQMDDPAFVTELRDWIRFSPTRALETRDGLFSACSGNPTVPEWLGRIVFDRFFTKQAENDKYRDHIHSSAGIAVFVANTADPANWIKVGRSFQRFSLQATALGVRNAHVNQPIEVPEIRSEFAAWLGVPDARPDLIVRFGRAAALPMSLRRPVQDVIYRGQVLG